MARNERFVHTAETAVHTESMRVLFGTLIGKPVTFAFTKRDGTPSTVTGTVESLGGSYGTEIVTLTDTDRGRPVSANLWTVSNVQS